MKSALHFLSAAALLLVISSCSDDPVSTGGGSFAAPEYHASLQSMDGDILAVCGTAKGDLYALGPALLHYDGSRWGTIDPPPQRWNQFRFMQAFADGSMFVSDGGATYVRTGDAWTDVSDADSYANAFWGSAVDDLYSLGFDHIRHYDGVAWSEVTLPDGAGNLYAISGRSANDVVVSGRYGKLFRFDGTQWSAAQIDSNVSYDDLAVTASGRVFGATYREVYEITGGSNHLVLRSIITSPMLCADNEVLYTAGRLVFDDDYFIIAKLDHGVWENVTLDRGSVRSFWAGDGNVIAGGWQNLLWRGNASGGGIENAYPHHGGFTCASNIDGELFLAGSEVYRYNGGAWTSLDKETISTDEVGDMAGRNRNDFYAVSSRSLLHYDDSRWTVVRSSLSGYFSCVWVDDTGDVWVGGNYSSPLYRLHAGNWSTAEVPFDRGSVYDIWGTDGSMFVVGDGGLAAVRRDDGWHVFDTHTNAPLFAVWGTSDHSVYAATGLENQILRYDGREWTRIPVDNVPDRYTIALWGFAPADMFVVDNQGALLHYDGTSWRPLERVFNRGAEAICGTGRELFAVNYNGAVSYHR